VSVSSLYWSVNNGRYTYDIFGSVVGDQYPFTGTYTDTGDDSYLYVKWDYPGQPEQPVPTNIYGCDPASAAVVNQQTVSCPIGEIELTDVDDRPF